MARTSDTVAGGVTRRDRIGSLGRCSATDTPLVLTEIGEANNWDTSAIAPWGHRTNIPGRDAKGALWAPHRSSDPPDVAVKADDHEWLVATMVQVLPHFFALDSAAPTRGEHR
jgi:hypothetical protein